MASTQNLNANDDELIKIGFVGAGGVSFGTKEGPWNHSVRLERMPNIRFTAVIDPNLDLAKVRLILRMCLCASFQHHMTYALCTSTIHDRGLHVQQRVKEHSQGKDGHKWEGCQVFKDYHEMLDETTKDKKPDAMIIGVPPWLHGELLVLKALLYRLLVSLHLVRAPIMQQDCTVEHRLPGCAIFSNGAGPCQGWHAHAD
jgi:predicted dehydrogenase